MKKNKKFIAVMLVVTLAIITFTGCTAGNEDLMDAIKKTSSMKSYETNASVKLDVSFDNLQLPSQEAQNMAMVLNMLKNIEANINQKVVQNEDLTKFKAESTLDYTLGGLGVKLNLWHDYDWSGDNFKMLQVMEVPGILSGTLAQVNPELMGKKYMVYDYSDYDKMLDGQDAETMEKTEEFMKEFMQNFMTKFQQSSLELLEDYEKDFDFDKKLVTYKGKEKVNEEKVSVYELKLDDKTAKEYLRYSVNYILDKEDLKDSIKDYLNMIKDMVYNLDSENMTKEEMDEEINQMLNSFDVAMLKDKFNSFMDKIEDIQFVGDEGIVMNFHVNKDGYVVSQSGTMDIVIDMDKLEETFNKLENNIGTTDEQLPTLNLDIEYNSNITNINGDIEIKLPELTDENSFSQFDLMMPQPQYQNNMLQ
ncbi:hypothetical protein [Dethiothermospora halolimnae]|uniref:hypothetical protein n=1 Tax=Dethiothermospora halolimnae TaxID=3114390 RepID=UPI003CCC2E07